jgi:hypothetical protein
LLQEIEDLRMPLQGLIRSLQARLTRTPIP